MKRGEAVKVGSSTSAQSEMERARRLPGPVPGVRVIVPLELVPAYLRLHGLTPTGFAEPDTLKVKRGIS